MTAPTRLPAAQTAGSADPGRPAQERLRPWAVFLQAHAAVARRLEAELQADTGISLADFDALYQLSTADGQRLRMSELADRVLLSRSGVTRLVDRLAADGLVARASCPTDARGAWATLTALGLDTLRRATPSHLRGVEAHFLEPIADADRDALVRSLEAVIGGLRGTRIRGDTPCDPTPAGGPGIST